LNENYIWAEYKGSSINNDSDYEHTIDNWIVDAANVSM
jgi:uncharacterized protein YeeX (DUF496 family)